MNNTNEYLIASRKWAEINRKLYFDLTFTFPGTYCYDLDKERLSLIQESNIEPWKPFAYGDAVAFEDKVVFVPQCNENIRIYDTVTGHFNYKKKKYNEEYVQGLRYGNKIILIPIETEHVNIIMLYDVINDIVEYPFENLEFDVGIKGYGCINEGILYLPVKDKRQVLKIEMQSKKYECIDINIADLMIEEIFCVDGFFYLAGYNPYIVKWDGARKCKKLWLDKKEINDTNQQATWLVGRGLLGRKLIYADIYGGRICELDVDNEEIIVKKILQAEDGRIIGSPNVCTDFCFFTVDIKGEKKREPYTMDKNGNIKRFEGFVWNETLNLVNYYSEACVEYSKYALQHFLNKITEEEL